MDLSLEESTTEKVPPIINHIVIEILSQNKSPDSIQKDIIFILITAMMIENGFLLVNDNFEHKDIKFVNLEQMSKWRTPVGIFETTFVLYEFINTPVKLIASPLGAMVLVNLVISGLNSETYTVCLPVSRYVVSPQASSVPLIFRNLKQFSITLKNKVLTPVKSKILNYYGYPSASLVGLPEEVIFKIIQLLPINDIVSLFNTCRRLKLMSDDESLWHELSKRDFDNVPEAETNTWKKYYKDMYIAQWENKLRQLQRGAGTMHDLMDYSDFVSYIENPMWDII